MKLSEAILLGSIGTPQATGALRRPDGGTCAMGSACVAAGIPIAAIPRNASASSMEYDAEFRINVKAQDEACIRWPILRQEVESPIPGIPKAGPLLGIIIVLNDMYKWTRPQIAEWVASMEPQEQPQEVQTCVSAKQSD